MLFISLFLKLTVHSTYTAGTLGANRLES